MKYQKIKIALIVLCVLAAGFCYSVSRYREGKAEEISLEEVLPDLDEDNKAKEASGDRKSGSDRNGESAGSDETAEEGKLNSVGRMSAGDNSSESGTPAPSFYVHICGEVISPGVYELEDGSRVFQAVEKAGGLTENAAAEYLNMAERISDGMKIVVLSKEEAEAAKARGELSISSSAEKQEQGQKSRINLNTATKEELMTLRGIGKAKADDILQYRKSRGGFQKIEDIMKISGIKDAAFQKIKEDITV